MSNLERTERLIGPENIRKLRRCRVAVFGLGGVGGHAAEALARSGIGALDLIDNDRVTESNLNRQLFALRSTIGRYKTDAAAERIRDIDPGCVVRTYPVFFLPETSDMFDFTQYDYVLDAVDTVKAKMELILKARDAGTPIISAMGAGNKMDPAAFRVADIYSTSVCPLARVIRQECRKAGIRSLKVVYSTEPPLPPHPSAAPAQTDTNKRSVPGSVAFVPSAAGLIMAGEVIRDLIS